MIVFAAAFGTFVLFLFLGLLALPATALLDKSIGKEKGLLVYAGLLLLFTFFVLKPSGPGRAVAKPGKETTVPAERLVQQGDPFRRANPDHEFDRNAFLPFSDTRPLPPVSLETPPWIAIDFSLPPPIPGPAPGYRRVLRGPLPKLTAGDGSTIAEIPEAVFQDYQVKAEDVYDWVMTGGRPFYVYIRAIHDGRRWIDESEPAYDALKWKLSDPNAEGYQDLQVRAAFVGAEGQAEKFLAPLDVLKAKRRNVLDKRATENDRWYLRRTVDNLFHEALRAQGIKSDFATGRVDPSALKRAAQKMADVGRTGKEGRAGWQRAVELLEAALRQVRATAGPAEVAEFLLELLDAQRALRDEQAVLRTLAEYIRTSPNSADARSWLGQLHLTGMLLPQEALGYFESALKRNSGFAPALIGKGDALSYIGQHSDALSSYSRASADREGLLRRATAELRMGRLSDARGTAESILSRDPSHGGALLVRGAVLYCQGDLETARGAFEQLASSPDANAIRAQACYNLGLTCIRLGQRDAANAAFDATEKALKQGSIKGPTPDEHVSHSLGRAVMAYAEGDESAMSTHLDRARTGREAPLSSYLEMFGGMVSSRDGNDASAIRSLDGALRRAPGYAELDGWLGKTYSRLGQRALETGAAPQDTAETFERAIAFAERAADREARVDREAWAPRLRECLVRVGAGHLPKKRRFEDALAAAEKVLAVSALREQPAALALSGYCNFQIGEYDQCIRRLQAVLDVVPDEDAHAWKAWRDYAEGALTAVKHWRSLEEKVVTFKSVNLDRQWVQDEKNGVLVRVDVEEGRLHFEGEASTDGRLETPIVQLTNSELFERGTFEQVTLTLRIPRSNRSGQAVNNVTFGVQVQASSKRGGRQRSKTPGMGVFYDKAKIAVRLGGGQIKKFKDGTLIRLDPERLWPGDDEISVRIVRENAERGTMAVFVNDELVIRDNISGFKQSRGKAQLWVGGYSTDTEPFDVSVGDIRVVRKKKIGR